MATTIDEATIARDANRRIRRSGNIAGWTFAVALTYKDTAAMMAPSGEDEIVRRLYPDQAKFRKEEQRRFEIVDAHWDVPLNELDLSARK